MHPVELPQDILGLHAAAAAVGLLGLVVGVGAAIARATRGLRSGRREAGPEETSTGAALLAVAIGGASLGLFVLLLVIYGAWDPIESSSGLENAIRAVGSLAAIGLTAWASARLLLESRILLSGFLLCCAAIVAFMVAI